MQLPSSLTNTSTGIDGRLVWLTRWLGVGVLALVAVTWKLWTPQDVFPRVPLFRWAPPDGWDWTSAALIAIGGLGLSVGPSRFTRSFAIILAVGFATAFLCDQHRLQPWAWQFFILALLIALADKPLQWQGWQWLTISIYFYSALSKFDARFLDTIGHTFAQTVFGGLFSKTSGYPPGPTRFYGFNYAVMWAFPVGELSVALLLAIPATRKWGLWAAIAMHGLLLQILGPFGLNHSAGVLMWNVYFVVHDALLFMPSKRSAADVSSSLFSLVPSYGSRIRNAIALMILAWVMTWPATYWFGLCDAWLAWAVYVPPTPRGSIDVRAMTFDHLPQLRQERILLPGEPAYDLPVGQWSLRTLRVPAYPSLRNMVAVALELAERCDSDHVRLMIGRHPDQANRTDLQSAAEIHAYARRFWFNAYPTSMYRRAARERAMKQDG